MCRGECLRRAGEDHYVEMEIVAEGHHLSALMHNTICDIGLLCLCKCYLSLWKRTSISQGPFA